MSALFHSYLCGRKAAEWLIIMNEKMKVFWGVLAAVAVLLIILSVFEFAKGLLKTIATIVLILAAIVVVVFLVSFVKKLIRK